MWRKVNNSRVSWGATNLTSYVHLPPLGHTSKINVCPPFVVTLVYRLSTSSSEESKLVTVRLSRIASDGSGGEPGNGGIPVTRPPPYQDMDVSARLGEDRGKLYGHPSPLTYTILP